MKTAADNRRQKILAGVLGVCALGACIFLYEELFGGSTPPPVPPPAVVNAPVASEGDTAGADRAVGPAARTVGKTSAGLDPTLHMNAMLVSESVVYSGSGRNIFSANSAPSVVIPKPIAMARVKLPPVIPCPPNCPPPAPPPPPPPIDLKFFGTMAGANGNRQAFLLHDEIVYVASVGDIVLRRYRVITVDAKAIQVEDMQNNNRQTLPLLAN